MSNSNEGKLVSAPETQGAISTRRNFLKWGIIGGLVAFPVGLTIHRKIKRAGYEYVLPGPFQLDVNNEDYRKRQLFTEDDWQGNATGKRYFPRQSEWESVDPSPSDYTMYSAVCFWANFGVREDVPDWFGADVTISIEGNNGIVSSKKTYWGAPHKEPSPYRYHSNDKDDTVIYSLPRVTANIVVPIELLSEIRLVRVRIEEFSS